MFSIMKNGHFGQKFQTIKTEQGNKEAEFLFSGLYGGQDFPGEGEKYEKKATEKMEIYSSGPFAAGMYQRQMGSGSRRKPGNGEQ